MGEGASVWTIEDAFASQRRLYAGEHPPKQLGPLADSHVKTVCKNRGVVRDL